MLRRCIDLLALFGVCVALIIAFYYQLALNELPCALCNLQRVGFMIFGAGLLLNLWSGYDPVNYVLSGIGALAGSLVALLQMFVHVLPGTPPTGTTFLGLHMYAISYIVFTCAMVYCIVALSVQTSLSSSWTEKKPEMRPVPVVLVATLFAILVVANVLSAFLENGFHPFRAGGQQHYQMLYDGDIMKP
jgi:disulfide bond formation protein DsbB